MVALLVAMSVMAVLMSAAMPTWRHMSQREKEAELIFRGQQYARAIGLFQRRAGPGVNPPSLDVLVQQKFLRKKYKDPITGDDFDLISPVAVSGGTPGVIGGPTRGAAPGRGQAPAPIAVGTVSRPGATGAAAGGIIGVASKSKEKSIRIYNGRNYYNEWQFIFVPQVQQPAGRGGAAAPGQRGGAQTPGRPGGIGDSQPQRRGGAFSFPPPGGRGPNPPPQPQRPPGR